MSTSRARFGSLDVRIVSAAEHLELLPVHFRVWARPDDPTPPDMELFIVDGTEARARVDGVDDALSLESSGDQERLTTSITELVIERCSKPVRARLTVAPHGQDPEFVAHYIVVNIRALLRRLGYVQLHGAAATIDGRTVVLLGDKGAGKSTLSLAIGRAGGTVLADDQLVLHVGDAVTISGVDGGLRLTAETERHFFTAPLAHEAQDFAGTLKKEVPLGDYVDAAPVTEAEPTACYFPRVGGRVEVVPIGRAVAVTRLLEALVPLHRFAGASDQLAFVRMITAFVGSVEVYDLTLSPDLTALDDVVAALADRDR
jgi:hypothetical protein